MEKSYGVVGMTCAHCVAAVSAEVAGVPGVATVRVRLAEGRVDVSGEDFDDGDVTAAVVEAGYAVTPL
jgi:copper chaperone